jgi:hypothetical protein
MGAPTAAQLIALWDRSSGASAHRRLERLLAAAEPQAALDSDTLGARNRRLLALHAALSDSPLDARLRCAACQTDNEFAVPAAAILDCRAPDPAARVRIGTGRGRLTFRLPLMSDIHAVSGAPAGDALARIVALCRVGPGESGPLGAADLERLAARFEALDPAARIVVDLRCAECRAALRASVDIAEFVAAAIDLVVDGLFCQIDAIARAYGWSERAILALPAARRGTYVAMIAARAATGQAPLALRA